MNKLEKSTAITELKDHFSKSKAAFFADFKGLTVEQANVFRKSLRAHNAKVCVVKNNLARIAAKEVSAGDSVEKMMDQVAGPTMIAFAYGDPAAVAKAIQKFAEENEVFTLKPSVLGRTILSTQDVKALSMLPSREVLLAKMLGSLNAPVQNFVGVLAAVPRSLVQVLSAIEAKKKS